MIRSIRDRETNRIFHGLRSKRIPDVVRRRGQRKLLMLHAAASLEDMRIPPGNHLEKLASDGTYSIRINDQWRVCFVWRDCHAYDVEIVDYHS